MVKGAVLWEGTSECCSVVTRKALNALPDNSQRWTSSKRTRLHHQAINLRSSLAKTAICDMLVTWGFGFNPELSISACAYNETHSDTLQALNPGGCRHAELQS